MSSLLARAVALWELRVAKCRCIAYYSLSFTLVNHVYIIFKLHVISIYNLLFGTVCNKIRLVASMYVCFVCISPVGFPMACIHEGSSGNDNVACVCPYPSTAAAPDNEGVLKWCNHRLWCFTLYLFSVLKHFRMLIILFNNGIIIINYVD